MSNIKLTHRENEPHELDAADFGIMGVTCYRGCLVHKVHGWYEILGRQVITPKEVDEVIDLACKGIEGSITVLNKGAISCTNTPKPADLGTDDTHVWER